MIDGRTKDLATIIMDADMPARLMEENKRLRSAIRVDFNRPFEWAHGPRWQQADLIRQDGIVYRWDEAETRYQATPEGGAKIEWQAAQPNGHHESPQGERT